MIRSAILLAAILALPAALRAQDDRKPPPQDPSELSIEDLLRTPITSVAKREQTLMDAPAAISVIRTDDLRRSGVTSVAEALRMVPGMQVRKIDANKWGISARGFADLFANKLLVLVDGRSVYTPLFSGVHWDSIDLMLEDVDRIEVIRGPGASLWGANAVNGVINIITKPAKDTPGGLVRVAGGTEERASVAARYGAAVGENAAVRVYAKGFAVDDSHKGHDAFWEARGGFRADWSPSKETTWSVLGDYFEGSGDSRAATPDPVAILVPHTFETPFSGGFLQARVEHRISDSQTLSAQVYYDHSDRDYTDILRETRDTIDAEFQHGFRLGGSQKITWGGGYRWTTDELNGSFVIIPDDETRTDGLVSAFLQDEIELVERTLVLTLGSKFEYNSYTQLEIQPGARVSWKPHADHQLWASAARAVRTPTRAETDFRINQIVIPPGFPPPFPTYVSIFGNNDVRSEELLAYELGYRVLPAKSLSVDTAFFFNVYDRLRTGEQGAPTAEGFPIPTNGLIPVVIDNELEGRAYGAELALTWQPMEHWRLYGSYSYMRMNLDKGDSLDSNAEDPERDVPTHTVYLRSSLDLAKGFPFDLVLRYVDSLPESDVRHYVEMDVRLAWMATPDLEIALVGQNLIHDEHFEADDTFFNIQAAEVERGVYLSLSWRF
jgi:iron complex outermembrane receptor protein